MRGAFQKSFGNRCKTAAITLGIIGTCVSVGIGTAVIAIGGAVFVTLIGVGIIALGALGSVFGAFQLYASGENSQTEERILSGITLMPSPGAHGGDYSRSGSPMRSTYYDNGAEDHPRTPMRSESSMERRINRLQERYMRGEISQRDYAMAMDMLAPELPPVAESAARDNNLEQLTALFESGVLNRREYDEKRAMLTTSVPTPVRPVPAPVARPRYAMIRLHMHLALADGTERSFDCPIASPLNIGRGAGNDISLPDPSVSRRHIRLMVENDQPTVTDLGSVNGTLLNGRRMQPSVHYPLENGAMIRLGRSCITVNFSVDNG